MRMWGVDPKFLCSKHLTGEHVEMHMLVGSLKKGLGTKGYREKKLLDLSKIRERHDELAEEMLRRGMKHESPIDPAADGHTGGEIDIEANLIELQRRCTRCAERIAKYK